MQKALEGQGPRRQGRSAANASMSKGRTLLRAPAIVEMPAGRSGVLTKTFAPILYVMKYSDFDEALPITTPWCRAFPRRSSRSTCAKPSAFCRRRLRLRHRQREHRPERRRNRRRVRRREGNRRRPRIRLGRLEGYMRRATNTVNYSGTCRSRRACQVRHRIIGSVMTINTRVDEAGFSARLAGYPRSGSLQILQIGARAAAMKRDGKPVIVLGAGEPDFETPDHVKQAAWDHPDAARPNIPHSTARRS
jgi:hypothetical protein